MADAFFDNKERQNRLTDLLSDFHFIRGQIKDDIKSVIQESEQLRIELEILGEGITPVIAELEARVKEKMTAEEIKENQEILDGLEVTNKDLAQAWKILQFVNGGYLGVELATQIGARYGPILLARAVIQAIDAAQLGQEVPAAAGNLAANGVRAMNRQRGGAFHIDAGDPALVRADRIERFANVFRRAGRISNIIGAAVVFINAGFLVVDVAMQVRRRLDLIEHITKIFGYRHIVKQLQMAVKSAASHVTRARMALNDRATAEETCYALVRKGDMTLETMGKYMADFDAEKMGIHKAQLPTDTITLPLDQDVYEENRKRDDRNTTLYRTDDMAFAQLVQWLETELAAGANK